MIQTQEVNNGAIPEVVLIVAKILLNVVPIMLSVAYLTLAERKVIGYVQVRIGPNRVGPRGLLQPIADGLTLLLKEIIIPTNANRFLFILAPLLALAPALAAWAVVPFDDGMVLADIDAGLLSILALTSMSVSGIIIAGWASNSIYACLGALRSAAQVVSYESAMGFALVGVLLAAGSMNLGEIVRAQQGSILHWYWLPLLPLFLIYFISGVAVALVFLAEYAYMILVSALAALLFCGGWLSPFQGIPVLGPLFAWVPGLVWLLAKMAYFLILFLWFRATFPRYRYDQIMRLGWKVFIPITIVWRLVVGAAVLAQIGPWFY